MNAKVAVIDAGGRGAALIDTYSQSPHVESLIAIPGNDMMGFGIERSVKTFQDVAITDAAKIVELCKAENIDLVDVAQDDAVAAGVSDALRDAGFQVFGPSQKAGQIEWDKAWAREFGKKIGLPQPEFHIFHSEEEGIKFITTQPEARRFVKASGLAAGKGALPAKSNTEAIERIRELKSLGDSGKTYLIEEWLVGDDGSYGEEFSMFILSDGTNYKILGCAQDHKRALDNDEGENTGGMGAYTPISIITPELQERIEQEIVRPVINGLKKEGRPYQGILYLGGMLIKRGEKLQPYVIEFNARWGDPEAQIMVPSITNDLYEVATAVSKGDILGLTIQMDSKTRIIVVGAAKGYPGDYSVVKGKEIHGLDEALNTGVKIYGSGIKVEGDKYLANGGRLFGIVAEGKTIHEAREKAYEAMKKISIEGDNLHFRTDIGLREQKRMG